ncbi:MAG: transcriptional regulator [Candidatus Chisholmbacteria bacterium RIFCSPHIGHO2_01_FULL_48_12]|uniref:Transcriptional regulator n=1 Tax=Candidatus Chisholmbacteria bacterium RIFCSPHIGHO2_01_FULL_48_12 TaxID=1797589 RepID=A0A1G1VRH8_9BACT|nr:MAG: transcriptional regulator [Candidatus Chisholmbacteria bacterium RIFCSPHIGHO2_01_FULL_48_12]
MKRQYLDFEVWKKQALKDPKLKAEYDRLQPEFAVIRAIIETRSKKGITQKTLAQKMKTKQSAISRIESGRANPSLNFLTKLAQAMNARLEINFLSQ